MNEPREFKLHGSTFRIVGVRRKDPDAGFGEARYNVLQMHDGWPWRSVQEERIPDHVLLTYACFGDYGGWRSDLPAQGFQRAALARAERVS